MQVYNKSSYKWNRRVGPFGNSGRVDPQIVSELCDKYQIPWYTSAWPYASGIKAYCESSDLWRNIIDSAKY